LSPPGFDRVVPVSPLTPEIGGRSERESHLPLKVYRYYSCYCGLNYSHLRYGVESERCGHYERVSDPKKGEE